MEWIKGLPRCAELNKKDLVEYLSTLGFDPADKKKDFEYWYNSPLNPPDRTPSFKINSRSNRWYDFSLGKGGSLVDFGILYYNCSVGEYLGKFENLAALKKHIPPSQDSLKSSSTSGNQIIQVLEIVSPALLSYLQSRGISKEVADQYCKEVTYKNNKGNFYAIGFQNKSGGYALRSKYFKGATVPNDVTHIQNGASEVAVFEGFFSFLSFVQMNPDMDHSRKDYLILNSNSHFEKAKPIMESYDRINLYLDHDKSGMGKTKEALTLVAKYQDMSGFYNGYNDCNKFLIGEPIIQHLDFEKGRKRA